MSKRRKGFRANIYRDSWDLDNAFYKWIRPRLKCFREFANGWPDNIYPTFEDFMNDIDEKITWLDYIYKHECTKEIITDEDIDKVWNEQLLDKHFPDWRDRLEKAKEDNVTRHTEEYLSKLPECFKDLDINWYKTERDNLITETLVEEFGEWFGKRHRCLWW